MMNCVLLYFVLEVVFEVNASGISEIHYKRVFIKDVEISGYYESRSVISLLSCSMTCGRSSQCRSFSYLNNKDNNTDTVDDDNDIVKDNDTVDDDNDIVKDNDKDDDNLSCYLYSTVAILTPSSIPKTGLVYYWKLAGSCPASYQKNSKISLCFRKFLVDPDIKTVPAAEERCEQDGGHLIIIDTDERRTFLSEFLRASGYRRSLVGGMELGTGTEAWYWYNGANVTNWLTNQPSDSRGIEDCLQAVFTTKTTQFNDVPCGVSQLYPFICEIPIV